MQAYEKYSLALCLIVFALLAALSAFAIYYIVNTQTKLIACGGCDGEIKTEYSERHNQKRWKKITLIVVDALICLLFTGAFIFAMCVNTQKQSASDTVATVRVVKSDSMASKYKDNAYLFANNLNDQFAAHDLVLTYALPDEFDLKLYDVVVYEADGEMIIHRIVGIEEPNADHPTERYFRLQGDAVQNPDRFPVLYGQMRGIYRGERVAFVGSFVEFLHSFAGWLCLALILSATILSPILERYLDKKRAARFAAIGGEAIFARENVGDVAPQEKEGGQNEE